ncbi:hypothetical protein UlMin_018671 [Ulmus minor]
MDTSSTSIFTPNGSFNSRNPYLNEPEENDHNSTGSDSPRSSALCNDPIKLTSVSSPKKSSRRAVQKRVVSIPIKEVEGSRLKGETGTSTPPSDSWAWRKYGQKPIKGSPYPRGYYRCSSSKGCPARKQVERSRVDPTMLVVTYSAEHNHPWPASRNHHHQHHHNHNQTAATSAAPAAADNVKIVKTEPIATQSDPDPEPDQERSFADLGDETLMSDDFGWFVGNMETTSSPVLESPIFADGCAGLSDDVAMVFPMREEDELLFADLGELPECSLVFRHRGVGPQVGIC